MTCFVTIFHHFVPRAAHSSRWLVLECFSLKGCCGIGSGMVFVESHRPRDPTRRVHHERRVRPERVTCDVSSYNSQSPLVRSTSACWEEAGQALRNLPGNTYRAPRGGDGAGTAPRSTASSRLFRLFFVLGVDLLSSPLSSRALFLNLSLLSLLSFLSR